MHLSKSKISYKINKIEASDTVKKKKKSQKCDLKNGVGGVLLANYSAIEVLPE